MITRKTLKTLVQSQSVSKAYYINIGPVKNDKKSREDNYAKHKYAA